MDTWLRQYYKNRRIKKQIKDIFESHNEREKQLNWDSTILLQDQGRLSTWKR